MSARAPFLLASGFGVKKVMLRKKSKPETEEHKTLKELLCNKFQEWYGPSLTEYQSTGHELDVFAVTPDGISICVEIIWSNTFTNFLRDMNLVLQSDADVKIAVVNPEILSRKKCVREFTKIAISQRRIGVNFFGELIDGQKMLDSPRFLNHEFKEIVSTLIEETRSSRARDVWFYKPSTSKVEMKQLKSQGRLQRDNLQRKTLQNLIRYGYKRTFTFLGQTGVKDKAFMSNTIKVLNDIEYSILNSSSQDVYVGSNGVLLKCVQDVIKTSINQSTIDKLVDEMFRFRMSTEVRLRTRAVQLVPLPLSSIPLKMEEVVAEKLVNFTKLRPARNRVYGVYEIIQREDYCTFATSFVYLEPIHPKEKTTLKFQWLSSAHPWNTVSLTLQYYTKGFAVFLKDFPKTYRFSMLASLLKEREESTGEFEEPIFIVRKDEAARLYETDELLAPGSHFVAEWKDSSMKLVGR